MNLYVIRHGETIINAKKLANGRNFIGINKEGKKQAKVASEKIKNFNIDLIICSPLRRTKQTCKIINKNKIEVIYDNRLLERDTASMQFKKVSGIDNNEWYDPNKDIVYKDAEGFKSVIKRVEELLEEIQYKYKDKNILLVTHGDVCKAIYFYLNKIEEVNDIISFKHKNCEIKKYTI